MNDSPEKLLDDVLTEAATADFRDAMLGETLRLVRRHRRQRQMRRVLALLIAVGLCGIFIWQKNLTQKPIAPAPASPAKVVKKNYKLVETKPLPASDTVTTQPLASKKLVASAAAVTIVQSRSGNYRVINDDELLALVASHPAVLIRTGPHSEELVFANPKDQSGFPLN
jgi:cytoskeletal protein RodZ